MPNKNGRLVALVASIAVAAVAIGAALAYRQGPQAAQADAAPLSGSPSPISTPTPTPTPKPSVTPSATAVTTPKPPAKTPTKSGPLKSKVNLPKLPEGRAPQVTYLAGRTVRGGPGQDVKVPGSADILEVARLHQSVLAVVQKGTDTEMLTVDSSGKVLRTTPDVTGIVTTEDGLAAAYVATRRSEQSAALPGAVVYAEQESVRKLDVPDIWDAVPLGYLNGKVYFRGETAEGALAWNLYEWVPGAAKASVVKSVPKPSAVSDDGSLAASLVNLTDYNSCTNVVTLNGGKRLWRTCDYQVVGFTRDGATAIGAPFYRDGYADGIASALDAKTGTLLHEWSGTFRQSVAEDDQHLLLLADTGPDSPASIIRCSTVTGACERATPLATGRLAIGS
ncbi:hypothetical protein [Kribbella capetownensis]|uniref:hypothetical protein n=1 Tax=Kribbella capetownensis TaxID=1572659 RepID=UPI0013F42991|nr:hypothetical protein [Kribbella capetownensis]